MIDLHVPVPKLSQCVNHHVACVEAETFRGVFCWGWHLTAWDDEWPVKMVLWLPEAIERLTFMLITEGIDPTTCLWRGRGLEKVAPLFDH